MKVTVTARDTGLLGLERLEKDILKLIKSERQHASSKRIIPELESFLETLSEQRTLHLSREKETQKTLNYILEKMEKLNKNSLVRTQVL